MNKPNRKDVEKKFWDFLNGGDLSGLAAAICDYTDDVYDAGIKKGKEDGYEEAFQLAAASEEKVGAEYAWETFNEVQSFEEFQDKLRWVNNTRMNYM